MSLYKVYTLYLILFKTLKYCFYLNKSIFILKYEKNASNINFNTHPQPWVFREIKKKKFKNVLLYCKDMVDIIFFIIFIQNIINNEFFRRTQGYNRVKALK